MVMKIYFLFLVNFLLLAAPLTAQQVERERIYVQTDKQLYVSGELLWMKLYTTDAQGNLTSLSKVGYVELLSDSIAEIQVKLDVLNGSGMGWMELPPMLPTGYYRLIAYTRNMQNEGENVFFEKKIAVVNPYIREEEQTGQNTDKQEPFMLPTQGSVNSNSITTDKEKYRTRSRGEIQIKDLPADYLSLAVSVAGVDPLFESKPLITEWKNKLPEIAEANLLNLYTPEYEGAIIEGNLINLETEEAEGNKMVSTLLSFPGKEIQLFGGKIAADGHVSFFTHQIAGKKELVTTAYDPYKKNYRVDILSPFVSHKMELLTPLEIDSSWQDYLEERSLAVQVVEAYTADSLSRIQSLPTYFNYPPHKEYKLDEYTRFGRMDEIFIEFINYARIRREGEGRVFNTLNERMDGYSLGKTLVLLDNIPVIDHELMVSYNPLLISKIGVYLGRYLFGGQFYDGIISFSTYNNNYPGIAFGANTQLFDFEGTQAYRYFYTPVYGEGINSRMPDFRHTQLWEPALETEGEKEITIPFYTSDIPGYYRITVEGIGRSGSIVSASRIFEVME